jgi:hypothetical protein
MPARVGKAVVAMAVAVGWIGGAAPVAGSGVTYGPPVDAPIADGFRPPPTPYGRGNRGLEYATTAGTPVLVAAEGEVVFAGNVGGALHVTVAHPDTLRTSYSFLAEVDVARGQRLRRGERLGTAATRLHFGVRDLEDRYLDPTSLFAVPARPRARLVPSAEDGAAPLDRAEVAALWQIVLASRTDAFRLAMHYAIELRPDVRLARTARSISRLRAQQQACTPADQLPSPPRGRRIALLVGGLGSTSGEAAVDDVRTTELGYATDDVVRFSYNGGRIPDPSDGRQFDAVPTTAYGPLDSTRDLARAAAHLAQLLVAVSTAQPGAPIDVIAHSQGGLVARLAIAEAHAAGALPSEVSTLVTLGAPHDGTDLATAVTAVGRPVGPVPAAVLSAVAGQDVTTTSIGQMSEVSQFVDRLDELGLPPRVHRVSIAARGDLVVPLPRTIEHGFPSAVVDLVGPSAHGRLPGAPSTTREIALAVAGRPPTCSDSAVVDAIVGEAVSFSLDMLGGAGVGSAALTG